MRDTHGAMDEAFSFLNTVYLPDHFFGLVESRMLRGELPAFSLISQNQFTERAFSLAGYYAEQISIIMWRALDFRKINNPIYFCILDDFNKPSAFATKLNKDVYCIFVSTSIFVHISATANIAMSYLPIIDYFGFNRPPIVIEETDAARSDSFDDVRNKVITNMQHSDAYWPFVWGSLLCMINHELGHIINGHLDFKSVYAGKIRLLDGKEAALLDKTLEFDADSFCTKQFILHFQGQTPIPHHVEAVLGEPERLYAFCMISLVTMFQFEDITGVELNDEADAFLSHPPLRWRLFSCIETLHQCLAEVKGADYDAALIPMKTGMQLSAGLLMNSGDRKLRTQTNSATLKAEVDMRMKRLNIYLSVWAAIRDQLSLLKLGSHKLAPAQQPPDCRFDFSR